jgi:hypothetical protein
MALSFDGSAFAWQTFGNSYAWNVAAAHATHTVAVKYRDLLGNESAVFSAVTCVDASVPTTPTVVDDGEYSPFLDKLHASWNSTDAESGISHYLVRIGTAAGLGNIVAETNVGNATSHTFSGLTLDLSGVTKYYFTVYAVNRAGGVSAANSSDGIKGGDPTPPDPFIVTDEGQFTADKTRLAAAWTASNDPDSGINRYEFAVGTAVGSADVIPWTSVSLTLNHAVTGLSLLHGQVYYINVRAYNNGGTYAGSNSDGIIADIVAPPVPVMLAEPAYSSSTVNLVSCSSVVDDFAGGVKYDFQRATNSGFTAGLVSSGWVSAASHEFSSLVHGVTYYYRARSCDAVGNTSDYSAAVSSVQDCNAPVAGSYTDDIPALNNDPDHIWSRDTSLHFTATGLTDDLSGVRDVYVQISDSPVFSSILSKVGSAISVAPVPVWLQMSMAARFLLVPDLKTLPATFLTGIQLTA